MSVVSVVATAIVMFMAGVTCGSWARGVIERWDLENRGVEDRSLEEDPWR